MSAESDALREPWETLDEQKDAAHFGLWIFIASEVLFFGAFMMSYAYLRIIHPAAYAFASSHTEILFGTINTGLLLTSGLTMALGVRAASLDLKRECLILFSATACLGLGFLVVKGLEYAADIHQGLVPGAHFALKPAAAQLFFADYWTITVIHLIHLSIGIGLTLRLVIVIARSSLSLVSPEIEITGLYWALVDIVWVLLFPLIYLGGRA